MSPEQLTIVYKLDTLAAELALDGIQSVLTERGVPLNGFKLYGETSKLTQALAQLKRANRKTFNIVGRGFEFDLSCVRNFRLDFQESKPLASNVSLGTDGCPSSLEIRTSSWHG